MKAYGVTYNGIHTDVSRTEQGAKNFATRNGYNFVSVRYNLSCNVQIIAEKNKRKMETFKRLKLWT